MDMKRDYFEDIRLFESKTVLVWSLLFVFMLAILPFIIPNYYTFILNLMMIYIVVSVGLNILVGNTGQISLGHAGFFAIGAYGTVLLMTHLYVPFIFALIIAGIIAAFFGFLLGLPALRLEGPYLAIATLGFGLTIMHLIGRWDFFGGRAGIDVPVLNLGIHKLGIDLILDSDRSKYYLFLIMTIILVIVAKNILHTRIGRSFVAIRDSDIAAESMGVNITIYKTLAFAASAFYAGIAGGLYAFVVGFIDPFTFNLSLSVIFLVMVVVGGLGSIMGSISGAILITYLQFDLLKNISEMPWIGHAIILISNKWFNVVGIENISLIILGLIMISIIIFEPLGMYGTWLRIKKYWETWPF